MDPLIITATANICWLNPSVPYPKTPAEIIEEALLCQQNGASLIHTHAEGNWIDVIRGIRATGSSVIIQCGMSSLQIPERMDVFHEHADMMSIIISHHDEAFTQRDFHVLHPREELEEYMRLCNEYGVKPELEVWNTGSIWNMNYLIDKGLLKPPYFATLFFGWPGGQWSPATLEEYLYRRKYMPEGSVINVSVMGKEQLEMIAAAVIHGDHIRVGAEDNPYNLKGEVVPTHALVAEAAEIARSVGRPIATAEQARAMLGLKPVEVRA